MLKRISTLVFATFLLTVSGLSFSQTQLTDWVEVSKNNSYRLLQHHPISPTDRLGVFRAWRSIEFSQPINVLEGTFNRIFVSVEYDCGRFETREYESVLISGEVRVAQNQKPTAWQFQPRGSLSSERLESICTHWKLAASNHEMWVDVFQTQEAHTARHIHASEIKGFPKRLSVWQRVNYLEVQNSAEAGMHDRQLANIEVDCANARTRTLTVYSYLRDAPTHKYPLGRESPTLLEWSKFESDDQSKNWKAELCLVRFP